MLEVVKERMESLGVVMKIDETAIDLLSEQGFDPVYGARPLRRKIQSAVEDQIAEMILDGSVKTGESVAISAKDGKIELKSDEE